MHLNRLSPLVMAAALSACAVEPESLNSERIEQRFGSYGIEVLSQSSDVRHSNLYSLHDGQKVCRTYAVVRFVGDIDPQLLAAHMAVLSGESIGATFKAGGWTVAKATLYIGRLRLDDTTPIAQVMQLEDTADIAVHVYRLVLEGGGESIDYATIVEAHHPDYLDEQELLQLYGEDWQQRDEPLGDISTLLMNID